MKPRLLDPAHLKLSHKGLIMVSVPLVAGILFVAALYALLTQTETEARREAHSKAVLATAQQVMKSCYEAGTTLFAYAIEQDNPLWAKRYDDLVATIQENMSALEQLVGHDPLQADNVSRLRLHTEMGIRSLNDLKRTVDNRGRLALLSTGKQQDQVKQVFSRIVEDAFRVQVRQKAEDRADPPAEERWRLSVKQFLLIGIAANVVIAVSLALFFMKSTTRRLEVLMDNTMRLADKKPLNPEMSGSDEIARLDHVFHNMAQALDEAARKEQEIARLKQNFVATVTHELRTPLTSIQGYLELLGSGTFGVDLEGPARQGLEIAERNAGRLIKLINDLLAIEKLESGLFSVSLDRIPLADVFAEAREAVAVFAGSRQVILNMVPTSLTVFGDEDRIVQVLVNLISNAVKFSEPGGTVSVEAAAAPGFVEVRVSDEGRGIPAQFQTAIFERFQQVDAGDAKVRGGTGLGLAISKAIVEQHKGTIGVTSREGQGSTFWFRLPEPGALAQSGEEHV